ncbi:hypothetical protein GCM10022258_13550 [Aquimarina gracilis]
MLVIWGIVFNKIFNFFGDNPQNEVAFVSPVAAINPRINFSKDTFELKKINRDPFLGKYIARRTTKLPTKTKKESYKSIKKKRNNKMSPSIIPWPKISYHGYVRGAKSTSELILIRVNNKFHKIREGSKIDDVLIKKVYRDSVLIKRNKQSKMVIKSR